MIEIKVRLFATPLPKQHPDDPDRGAFTPATFTEWVGHEVYVTGLDPTYRHILTGVENTPDGLQSQLTIHTYGIPGSNLTADLSIRPGTPKAQVRAYFADDPDTLATTAWLDAPLNSGQLVTVNGAPYRVQEITYPYRDPEHPENTEDYQHVILESVPELPPVQSLSMPGGALMPGMLGMPGMPGM